MKAICKFSGYILHYPAPFKNLKLSTGFIHPIFSLSLNALITNKNKLELPEEKQLYTLAILKHFPTLIKYTSLIEYTALEIETFEAINQLLSTLPILAAQQYRVKLPTFVATAETVNNLTNWIKNCEEVLLEYNNAEVARIKEKELKRQQAQARIISRHSPRFATTITKWLFSTVNFPDINITGANRKAKNGKEYFYLSDYWHDLFKAVAENPSNCFFFPKADLEELYNYLLDELENTNDNATSVYTILNNAVKEFDSLTIDTGSLIGVVSKSEPTKNIIDSSLVGTPEPKAENFSSKVQFLVAKAKWNSANRNNQVASTNQSNGLL